LAGDVVDDRYRLLRKLGEGAAGVVWFARDAERNIHVALKLLHGALVDNEDMRARFAQEAELSGRMLSPHIVKIFSTGVAAGGSPYIVYEHLEGRDLGARLRATSTLGVMEMKTIVVHVARALARAHSVGVLHRDVKPENIFLTKDQDRRDLVKVLDFGVAELTKKPAQEIVGTLEYIAPDVLMGERPADTSTDLYALGVVAYECCTGKTPFPADNIGQLVAALATQPLRPTGIDEKLDAWFAKTLARNTADRFGSAKELAEALHVATRHLAPPRPSRELRAVLEPAPAAAPPLPPRVADLPPMRPRMASFVFDEGESPPSTRYSVSTGSRDDLRAVRGPSSSARMPAATPPAEPKPSAGGERPPGSQTDPSSKGRVAVVTETHTDRPRRRDPRSEG
jgi:eukaryotic-like serine/threonine-protein kinase